MSTSASTTDGSIALRFDRDGNSGVAMGMMAAAMNRLSSITCLFMLGCSASKSPSDAPRQVATEHAEPEPSAEAETGAPISPPAEDERIGVELSPLDTTLTHTVPTGTTLRYSYKSHASVGYGASYDIGDPTVLGHLRTDVDYVQSEQERAGKAGADRATGTFVFEALAPGSSTLHVQEVFRGSTEREIEYTITVVEP
jgi:hypothetical protein